MSEIQTGLGKRMKYVAEIKIIAKSQDRVSLPKLVHSGGNFSMEDNVIGEIQYLSVKLLQVQQQTDSRCPEKPFKEILQGKF